METNIEMETHIEELGSTGEHLHRFEFPNDIYRVTAGGGGEAILIDGGDVVAIYDCGMACSHEGVIKNIKEKLAELGHSKLDKAILSHSHYDHIGALPYIIDEWPDIEVIGARKLVKVFASEGARATMKRLGEAARDKYLPPEKHDMEIVVDGFRVDTIVEDGDHINVGKYDITAIWTPGHTDCSFTYLMNPGKIMFTSETMGVLENEHHIHSSFLKSFEDTIVSAEKCKAYNPDVIICSHYGLVPDSITKNFFDLYIKCANTEKDFILGLYDRGLSYREIAKGYEDEYYWNKSRIEAQPVEAFRENLIYTVPLIIRTFRGEPKDGFFDEAL